MSRYSEKIEREKQKGLYKVSDLEGGKEVTHTIDHLMEDVKMFDRTMDILVFRDTPRQLQVNVTNGDALIKAFGTEPDDWAGRAVTLFLQEYQEGKFGIRVKAADTVAGNGPSPATRSSLEDMNDEIPY